MKIYGQTDDLIVREMTGEDVEKFLEFMTERGANEDFTVEDIENLRRFRDKKGDVQCTITSIDGKIIYGFCGLLPSVYKASALRIAFFERYKSEDYITQVNEIMTLVTLEKVFFILNTPETNIKNGNE